MCKQALVAAALCSVAPYSTAQIITQTDAFYSVSASADGNFGDTQTSMQLGDVLLQTGSSTSLYTCNASINLSESSSLDRYSGIINCLAISRGSSNIDTAFGMEFVFTFTVNQPASVTVGTNNNGWRYQDNGEGAIASARMFLYNDQGTPLVSLQAPEFTPSIESETLLLTPGDYQWVIEADAIVPSDGSLQTSADAIIYPLLEAEPIEPCSPADLTTTGATLSGQPGFGFPDGVADFDDLGYYLNLWSAGDLAADYTTSGATLEGQPGFGVPDGAVTLDDLGYYLNFWVAGCS